MRAGGWLLLAGALAACRDETGAPIRLVVGPGPRDEATLLPRAALAEYIEMSPSESALLLTFSSTEQNCEGTSEPSKDATGLSLRLVLPEGVKLGPGSYSILAAGQASERAHVLATIRLAGRRHELRPGGELTLRQVDLSPQGAISGLLGFEFPGDAEQPATRASGHFLAHFCRINRLR